MAISTPHAALLCIPVMGHVIPVLELAKRLVTHQIIPTVTFFLASIKNSVPSKAEAHVLQSAMKSRLFDIMKLPPIDITELVEPDATTATKVAVMMQKTPPLLLSAISTMKSKPTILITDLIGSQALPLAKELKSPKFVFLTSNAWLLALSLHGSTLDKEVQGQYAEQTEPFPIPGCKPINPGDLFHLFRDRTNRQYHEFLRVCEVAKMADGFLVNTLDELEPKTLAALNNGEITKVPVYSVGPLIRGTSQNAEEEKKSYVLDWLDDQDEESVIYVSFGSGYNLSYEQIKELALGLELSEKKFVWSLRPPSTKNGYDNYLTAGEETITACVSKLQIQPSNSLPEEIYRIQKNGIFIMDWAPQLDILKHPSIGGFLSHCGWNSILESVSCGVPIVAWPLFAEQRMNAAMLAEEVGIAVRVEVPLGINMVGREEIAKAIRKIMNKDDKEGYAMRDRVKELKNKAERAWSQDGSSYLALSKLLGVFSKMVPQMEIGFDPSLG